MEEEKVAERRRFTAPSGGGDSSRKVRIWPIVVNDLVLPDPKRQRRCRLSRTTKAFMTMAGSGLATAFVLSPLLLLFDSVTLETYILLSCLMALTSFLAGVLNYHVVLSGAREIVEKARKKGEPIVGPMETPRSAVSGNGEIDAVDELFERILDRLHLDMEERLRVEQDAILAAISSLAVALEAKDPYTRTHSRNVARYSAKLAQKMGLTEAEIDEIHLAGQLHDIGKIGIRDEILLKPGSLTPEEFWEIKKHPELSLAMLRPLRHLDNIRAAIRHHHERIDGSGYPDGLKGEDIPLGARIMAVVDAFDAMTSDRPYRPALSFEEAVAEIKRMSGRLLDPKCVTAFLELLEEDPEFMYLRLSKTA